MRLQWDAFCSWLKNVGGREEEEEQLNVELVNSVLERYRSAASAKERGEAYLVLCNAAVHINTLLNRFKQVISSQLFKFWDDYVTMVLLLLKFIRTERESNWKLHLEATTEMIPHFCSMDRVNYARWLPVYIMDMRQLPEKAPEVYNEFMNGNHAVSRSSQSFNQVWTDMALEQSVNRDSKSIGGIIGITQRSGALEKWFLTAHERTATTSATKSMLVKGEESIKANTHKESSKSRIRRDEDDIRKIMNTLKTAMCNPFSTDAVKDEIPLSNLATGVVMPADLSQRLLQARNLGGEDEVICKQAPTNKCSWILGAFAKVEYKNLCKFVKEGQSQGSR